MPLANGTLTKQIPIPVLHHGSHNIDRIGLSRTVFHCHIIRNRSAGSAKTTVDGSNFSGRYG